MRYSKLVEMMKSIVREELKHRSSSQSHTMIGRYGRKKGQLRLAQEQEHENTGTTMTGQKADSIETDPVIKGSINQTR
jgi:hypothetical protein